METVWQTYGMTLIAFAIGFAKAGFGGGTGLLAGTLTCLFLPPRIGIPCTAPLMLFSDLTTLWLYRGSARLHLVRKLLQPAMVGTVVGAQLLLRLSETLLRQLIGFTAFIFVFYQLYSPSITETPSFIDKSLTELIFGFLAGLVSGFAHAGGLVIALYLVFLNLPPEELIATIAQLLLVINILKLAIFLPLELLPAPTLISGLLLIPFLFCGGVLARRLHRWLSTHHLANLFLPVIWLSGLALLIR